jgi:hypothetical protein
MSDVMTASISDKLWHKMRHDLAHYVPEIAGNRLLMCCACGRFLPQECFDLEHLIPQQALKQDPDVVRANLVTPANVRAANLLLCRKSLIYKGSKIYGNGCNSWKGRFYDKPIRQLVSGKQSPESYTQVHVIAALALGYLAMVAEFGYIIALMRSGLLMREQFFSPYKLHRSLPVTSKMVSGGGIPTSPDARIWANPFSFRFHNMACIVAARNFAVEVPVSRDPRAPLARHLRIVPLKYKLRPEFRAVSVFD